jgi:hypothetical protein
LLDLEEQDDCQRRSSWKIRIRMTRMIRRIRRAGLEDEE